MGLDNNERKWAGNAGIRQYGEYIRTAIINGKYFSLTLPQYNK
jgi:hypothetical protein